MNIFVLDEDPKFAAEMHCDRHVVKMILESAQILSTVHHLLGSSDRAITKPTHANHPCVKWAAASQQSYYWLYDLARQLCNEYTFRFENRHKYETQLALKLAKSPAKLKTWRVIPHPLCMPDDCKLLAGGAVSAYRNYYIAYKQRMLCYTRRLPPQWLMDSSQSAPHVRWRTARSVPWSLSEPFATSVLNVKETKTGRTASGKARTHTSR